eukprot:1179328-Prorocentrum_minimum.AAC.4
MARSARKTTMLSHCSSVRSLAKYVLGSMRTRPPTVEYAGGTRGRPFLRSRPPCPPNFRRSHTTTLQAHARLQIEEEYPAPGGGWARCEHHVEQLGPGAPRPCRRVATTEIKSYRIVLCCIVKGL